MKLGMVIYSADGETVWNAFRLGVFALKRGEQVSVFLLAKGVECHDLDDPRFNIRELMDEFVAGGGQIRACGTCLKLRHTEDAGVCEISTMEDLHLLVRDSDKVLTF
jgi:sulfur relay (sulfurtransferase) complex TusBCD TusD component (DsrE family)